MSLSIANIGCYIVITTLFFYFVVVNGIGSCIATLFPVLLDLSEHLNVQLECDLADFERHNRH